MRCVDGYLMPIAKKKLDECRRIASMDPASMPVDGKRMVWGGFEALVHL